MNKGNCYDCKSFELTDACKAKGICKIFDTKKYVGDPGCGLFAKKPIDWNDDNVKAKFLDKKDMLNYLPSGESPIEQTINKVIKEVKEDEEKFIIDTIYPFVKTQMEISKNDVRDCLIRHYRKGKWLRQTQENGDDYFKAWDVSGVCTFAVNYRCSICGFIHTCIEDHGKYAFCPSCGTDMREGE